MDIVLLMAIVFIVCCFMDVLYIYWYTSAMNDEIWNSAKYSMMIQIVGLTSVLLAVEDKLLVIPNILGHGVGSAIGTAIKKRRKKNAGNLHTKEANTQFPS